MGTPSLFPLFLKRGAGIATASGIVYVERFDVEILDMIEVEIVDETIVVEVVGEIVVEVLDDPIDVEIC